MKKLIILLITLLIPCASATWIHITEPTPGIYIKEEKLIPLKNMAILLGSSSVIAEAEGSNNIIAVYFFIYDLRNKDIISSYWDFNSKDGWNSDFNLSRGIYFIIATGTAIDIEEPIAIDWLIINVL